MKLPFFYSEHQDFKKHVEYVAKEMWRFHNDVDDLKFPYKVAEARAKDIVLWVGSRPVPWWERLIGALRGNQGRVVDDMFEAGLEKWLKKAIERAYEVTNGDDEVTGRFRNNLLRELGIDNQPAKVHSNSDQP